MKACFDWIMDRRARSLAKRLRGWIPPDSHVADVGSGTGHNAEVWRQLLGVRVDEFDVADLHWVGAGPRLFDGLDLPADNAAYRAVTLLFVLHYASQTVGLLRELRRISADRVIVIQSTYRGPVGRLLLNVRELFWGRLAFSTARMVGLIRGTSCPVIARTLFSQHVLEGLFQQAGLTILHRQPRKWWGILISRDLYVLRATPTGANCP